MLETATGLARKTFLKQVRHLQRQVKDMDRAIKQFVNLFPSLKQQVELADSIPGVALTTAATVIAELPPIAKVKNAKAAVALFGLDPVNKTSGKSVATQPRLSRMGSPRGRKALYMPALTALKCNPLIRDLGERLRAQGRTGKYVVVAAMRKLLRLIYGVLKHGKPFDASWCSQQRQTKAGALVCA
jgi:transposase